MHRVVKFINKPKLIICYKCSSPGHMARSCRSVAKCTRCSSLDHTKNDCPEKDNKNRENFKCPNCNGPHPATYAGCVKYKEALKQLSDKNFNKKRTEKKNSEIIESTLNPWTNKDNIEKITTQITQMATNLTKIEESIYTLTTSFTNEINKFKDDLEQFKKQVTSNMAKLVNELNAQDLKVVSFINEKQKGLDLTAYKSKLTNHFN